MSNKRPILVLGAGVSGLSTAILLQEAGYDVHIWAKDQSPHTTSDMAAAIWYPYMSEPREKVLRWGKNTADYLKQHLLDDPATGCQKELYTDIFDKKVEDAWWKDIVGDYRRPDESELPKGYVDGHQFMSIMTDMSVYMSYLAEHYKANGGTIEERTITDLQEALDTCDVVVNCLGLAAGKLCHDDQVFPVRGQVVKVKANGFNKAYVDSTGPHKLFYVVPRLHDIVLGGTSQKDSWNLEVDPADTEDILRKAAAIFPEFKDVEVVSVGVGLRPGRTTVRLEVEAVGDKHIVHNYGHGGSGFTLSWGCAQDVVDLVHAIDS